MKVVCHGWEEGRNHGICNEERIDCIMNRGFIDVKLANF